MARYISFAVLFAILVVVGMLFYKVMIGFFVPVFMAVVLVVVFRPLHRWVLAQVGGRDHVAASITTCLIVLIVLLPTALTLGLAAVQGAKLFENFNESSVRVGLTKLRANAYINLESPCAPQLRSIQSKILDIQKEVAEANNYEDVTNPQGRLAGDVSEILNQLKQISSTLVRFENEKLEQQILEARRKNPPMLSLSELGKILEPALNANQKEADFLIKQIATAFDDPDAFEQLLSDKGDIKTHRPTVDGLDETETKWFHESRSQLLDLAFESELAIIKMGRSLAELSYSEDGNLARLQESVWQLVGKWQDVRDTILGGKVIGFFKDFANPSTEQVRTQLQNAVDYVRPRLISFGGDSAAFIVRLLIGTTILMVSLYFFLCDGPGMVRSLMDLSPLDDRYEMELLAEFDRTSRAIVLATLLSALAQGVTAGLGYYVAGMPSLVMLTALTTICALIPFFGTAIVWVPVCMYLAIYEERVWPAILLAIWALMVVGTIDNLIKVLILHGQSQLHPLLALLSVLGGIQALGPIGIVVGPLVVTLLQTTLGIIRHELSEMKDEDIAPGGTVSSFAMKPLSELIRKVKKPEMDPESEPTTSGLSLDSPSSEKQGNAMPTDEPTVVRTPPKGDSTAIPPT
jgi:predicted PurR-regulated permease PerM